MKRLNVYKPRYKIPFQAKTKVFLYKESRLRRFFNIRGWKIVRRGLFKRIVVVLNNMKWTIARRYIRPFAKRRKSAKKERQYIRQFQNKQQIRHFYGKFKEEAFRNLFRSHLVGVYARNNSFYSRLESRVDMFLFRSRNFPTLYAANQYVFHQGIEYDGVKYNSPNAVIGTGTSLIFDEQLWDLFADNLFDKIDYRYFGKEILEKRKHYKLRKKVRYLLRRKNRINKNQIIYIKLIRKIISMQEYLPKLLKVLSRKFLIKIRKNNIKDKKSLTKIQIMRKLKIEFKKLQKECFNLRKDFIYSTKYNALYFKSKILENKLKKKIKKNKKYSKWIRQLKYKKHKITNDLMSKYFDKKNIKAHIFYFLRLTIKMYIKIATFSMNEKTYQINEKLKYIDQKLNQIIENVNTASKDILKISKNIKSIKPQIINATKKLNVIDYKKFKIKKLQNSWKYRVKYINWKIKYLLKNKKNRFFLKQSKLNLKKKLQILKNKINLNFNFSNNKNNITNLIKSIKIYSKTEQLNFERIKWYKSKFYLLQNQNKKLTNLIKNRKQNLKKQIQLNVLKTICKFYNSNTIINNKYFNNNNNNIFKTKKKRKKIKKIQKKIILNSIQKFKIQKIKKNNISINLKYRLKKKINKNIINYMKKIKFKNKIKLLYLKNKIINEKLILKKTQKTLNLLKTTKIISKFNKTKLNSNQNILLKKYENKIRKNIINSTNKIILNKIKIKNIVRFKLNLLNKNISNKNSQLTILNNIIKTDQNKKNKLIKDCKIIKSNKIINLILIRDLKNKNIFFNLRWTLPKTIKKTLFLQKKIKILKNRELKLNNFFQKNTKKLKALIAIKSQLEHQEKNLKTKLFNITTKSTQFIDNYVDTLRVKQRYKRWRIRWARKLEIKRTSSDINNNENKKKKEYEYKIWKNGIYYNITKRRKKRRKRRRASRFRRVHWYIPSYIYFDFESMQSVMTHAPKPKEIFYSFKASLTKLHAFYRSRGL